MRFTSSCSRNGSGGVEEDIKRVFDFGRRILLFTGVRLITRATFWCSGVDLVRTSRIVWTERWWWLVWLIHRKVRSLINLGADESVYCIDSTGYQ